MVDNILILAGGSGTRLWPASLKSFPKQFINVRDGNSLLALTIRRAISLNIPGKIMIITLKSQMQQVIHECIPFASTGKIAIIPEPEPKNTAPAIAAAVQYFRLSGNDPSLLVLPSDHIIEDLDGFRNSVEKADIMARKGSLVTFGIRPEYPETGYGYILKGTEEAPGFTVKTFTEKPDLAKAREFISSGNYLWNSGMFCFKASSYWNELEKHTPEITSLIGQIPEPGIYQESGISVLMDTPCTAEVYRKSPSISI
ncbi:MAG: mannose-1-phosphate guanylyltransferase, partial [Spirochaetia bacterium]|nr:mannose-1-phosphate guanylyltransferase [Spirochaetia bacterium]